MKFLKENIDYIYIYLFWLIPLIKREDEYYWIKISFGYFIVALISFLKILFLKKIALRKTSLLVFTFIFFFMLIVSGLYSFNHSRSLEALLIFMMGFAFYLHIVTSKMQHHAYPSIFKWALFISMVVSVYGLIQYYEICKRLFPDWKYLLELPICVLPKTQYGVLSATSTFNISNFAAEFVASSLPFSIPLFKKKNHLNRYFLFLVIFLNIWYIGISFNRASYVALFVSSIFLFGYYISTKGFSFNKRHLIKIIILFLAAGTFILLSENGQKVLRRGVSIFYLKDPGIQARFEAWAIAVKIWMEHPIAGVGIGNYKIFSYRYKSIRGEEMTYAEQKVIGFEHPHNEYINFLSEQEVVGVFIFGLLLYGIWKCFKKVRNSEYALSLITSIICVLTLSLFSMPLYNPAAACYWWGTLALLSNLEESKDEKIVKGKWAHFISFLLAICAFYISAGWSKSELYANYAQIISQEKWLVSKLYQQAERYNFFNRDELLYYKIAAFKNEVGDVNGAIEALKKCMKNSPFFVDA